MVGVRSKRGPGTPSAGTPDVQRRSAVGKRSRTDSIQRRSQRAPGDAAAADGMPATAEPDALGAAAEETIAGKDAGSPVPAEVRLTAESHLDADLSDVRVHDDAGARAGADAIGALAFTHQRDIFLGEGQRANDVGLMTHELTHVVQQDAAGPATQAKLEVGAVDDPAEREADKFASAAVAGPLASAGGPPPDAPPDGERALGEMSAAFGRSFDGVQLHTGTEAAQRTSALDTRAVTTGRDVYFAPGAFEPGTPDGKRVLAHELAHVVQQQGATPSPQGYQAPVGPRGDVFEQEANRAADDVMAGRRPSIEHATSEPVAQREEPKLSYSDYVKKYTDQLATGVIAAMSSAALDTGSPFASWKTAVNVFVGAASTAMAGDHGAFIAQLPILCAPESPVEPINRGRNAGDDGKSDDRWEPAVATEVANILVRRLRESLTRVVPRYAQATNMAYTQALKPIGPGADLENPPDPVAENIIPGGPIDKFVIPALIGKLKIDLKNYQKAHPDEKPPTQPRKLAYAFAAQQAKNDGKELFVQINDKPDPPVTAEDVALSIYGKPELASMLVGAGAMWGFTHPELLLDYEGWKKLPGNDGSADPNSDKYDPTHADPAKSILGGPGANDAALAHAANAPGTDKSDPASVAKRIRAASLIVDSMIAASKQLDGMGGGDLAGLKTRLDERASKVEADANASGGTSPWDGQSAAQLDILGSCSVGLQEAAKSWVSLKSGGPDSPAKFVGDPVKKVAEAFIDAASVSDLADTGRQRLVVAQGVLKMYPVDIVEGLLSYIRGLLQTSRNSQSLTEGETDSKTNVAELAKTEEDLRVRCAKLRDLILTDPAAASAELDKIRQEVKDLSDDSTVLALLTKENEIWSTLEGLKSKLGTRVWDRLNPWSKETRSKNQMYEDAQGELSFFGSELVSKVVNPAKKGDRKAAHAALIQVQAQFGDIFPRIAKLIDDQETREKWIKIGVLIGVGILSAGFADAAAAAGAADLGLEGAGLAAFKTGAEAAMFTALTTTTLEKDPTVQGVIADFVKNAVTFGLVGKAMASYKAALPGFADTIAGKATGISGMFVAHCSAGLAAADAKRYLETGQHLTEEEAKDAVLEGVLVTIGTLIGERVTHHFLEGMHLSGSGHIPKDIQTINAARDATKAEAKALEAPGAKADQAKAVIDKDGKTINAEKKTLDDLDAAEKDPQAAKSAGLTEADVASIKAVKGDRDAASTDIDKGKLLQLAASLKPIGGGVFATEGSGKFDELIKAHTDAKSHVTVTGEAGNRTAVIETADGQTLRVIEDENAAVGAKPKDKPVDPAEAAGTKAAVEQRAHEKAYTDSKTALLGRMKLNGDHYEIDGTGASMPEVVAKMRELGWQTMEVTEKKVTMPDGTQQTLRTARFEAHPDPTQDKAPYEASPQVITVTETKPFDPASAPPVDKAKYDAALSAIRARAVPNPLDLPPGTGNLEGTIKLEKLNRDPFLNGTPEGQRLIGEFYKMLGDRLKAFDDPATKPLTDLNGEIQQVMNARGSDGKPMFLERGPALTSADAHLMGDLDRAMDNFGLVANKCITQSYYESLLALKENLPAWGLPRKLQDIDVGQHAGNIASLMSVKPPDVMVDLDPSKPIGRPGAPGWWGAAADAGTAGALPASLDAAKYAKAVAAANLTNGGVLFRIPASDFVDGKVPAMGGGGAAVARRPTVFDSLWQNQFNPNPDAGATFGKTTPNPNDPTVSPVREVIMPTVTIGQARGRVLIK
jgi:hypothetical protein